MFSICDDLTPLRMAAWRTGEQEKRRRGGTRKEAEERHRV
jgi:hypothetical protein